MGKRSFKVPDDHIVWIGRVVEVWSQLEFRIDLGIWHLAATHQQLAACITAQLMSVHPRMRAFSALVQVRGGSADTIKRLNAFTASISGLSDRRNRCVHDSRTVDAHTHDVHRLEITARPNVRFDFVPETIAELQHTYDQIFAKVVEFEILRAEAIAEIEALPPESLPILSEIMQVRKHQPNPPSEPEGPEPPPHP